MSGRCCLGQDDGNGIRRAASQRPGHFGGAVIGDHAAIHYRTVVLAAGCILGPDQVSITAPVNHLPRVPAGVFAGRDGRTGPPRSGPVRGRERSRPVGSARAGRCGKSELALQVSCGTSAFPPARRTGSLLLHSGARYRFTRRPAGTGQTEGERCPDLRARRTPGSAPSGP